MTITSVTPRPTPVAPKRALAPAANAPAATGSRSEREPGGAPAVAAKAQAAPTARPKKFSDVESYKSYVMTTEATRLPAARAAVADAEKVVADAGRALAAKQASVNHAGLKSALDAAEAALTKATYPFRPQAAAKRAEADKISGQVAEIAKQIARAQNQIAQAEGNRSARNRDWAWGDDKKDGWDVVFDGIGALGDAASISSAKKRIQTLIDQKVAAEMKVTTLIAESTALHNQQADAGAIAAPKKARDEAQAAFDAAVAQAAPEQQALDAANGALGRAKGEMGRLEGVKKELTDYSQQFGFFARVKLFFTDWAWKKDLDAFWKSKGL